MRANVLEVLKPPALIPPELPDPEQAQAYAETVMPPPANIVAPIPELPALPDDLEKQPSFSRPKIRPRHSAADLEPASAYPAPPVETAKADPAIAIIADKIKDTPAMQDDAAHIAVQDAGIPRLGTIRSIRRRPKLDADDDESALAIYDRILARNPSNRAALAGKAAALAAWAATKPPRMLIAAFWHSPRKTR